MKGVLVAARCAGMVVALSADKGVDIGGAEAKEGTELYNRQLRRAPGGVVADPAFADAKALGDLVSREEAFGGVACSKCASHREYLLQECWTASVVSWSVLQSAAAPKSSSTHSWQDNCGEVEGSSGTCVLPSQLISIEIPF